MVSGFAVLVHPFEKEAVLISHQNDGSQVTLTYPYGDLAELGALILQAHQEIEDQLKEAAAEYAAECEQLAVAEGGGVQERETALELDFDRQGHDRF